MGATDVMASCALAPRWTGETYVFGSDRFGTQTNHIGIRSPEGECSAIGLVVPWQRAAQRDADSDALAQRRTKYARLFLQPIDVVLQLRPCSSLAQHDR